MKCNCDNCLLDDRYRIYINKDNICHEYKIYVNYENIIYKIIAFHTNEYHIKTKLYVPKKDKGFQIIELNNFFPLDLDKPINEQAIELVKKLLNYRAFT